ncbi:MAG TPA: AgmX/PglI C-terminal domain-containing protein, partial [Bdellovibrionota bacterium]|nr:AgmX/PglI C-terminal domain-containing protein [Bdellovibrionota bacterium]
EIRLGEIRMVVSHRGYALSNVIPFPDPRTEPHRPIPVAAPPAPRRRIKAAVVERVAVPVAIPRGVLWISVFALAGGLAWALNRYVPRKSELLTSIRNRSVMVPSEVTTDIPVEEEAPASEEVGKTVEAPPLVIQARKETRKNRPAPIPAVSPTPESTTGKDIVASLDRSLGGITPEGDLAAADRLAKTVRSTGTLGPKIVKAPKLQDMDVEIRLPTLKDIPLLGISESARSVNPRATYDPEKYRASLKEHLVGVEGCYVQHEKGGAAGRIAIWFSIASSGQVRKSGVESDTFRNKAMQQCILDRVGKVSFDPPPWDGFTTSLAFRFGKRRIDF